MAPLFMKIIKNKFSLAFAQRLSTIITTDKILVLDNGQEVERDKQ